MRRLLVYVFFVLLTIPVLYAERVTLRSGKRLTGTVLAQKDGIMLFETQQGQKFQIPMDEVVNIETDAVEEEAGMEVRQGNTVPRIAFRIALSGGLSAVRDEKCGGMTTAEIQMGTRQIGGKNIFLGGSIGYAGAFLSPSAHFFPIQAVAAVPIPMETAKRYCVEIDSSLGYAIATKGHKGGITGSLAVGGRIRMTQQSDFFAGITAQFVQTERTRIEMIGNDGYAHKVGTTMWLVGAKIALQF